MPTTTLLLLLLTISSPFDASWSAFEDKIFLTSSYTRMLELVACILTPHRFRVLYVLTRLSLLLLLLVRAPLPFFFSPAGQRGR